MMKRVLAGSALAAMAMSFAACKKDAAEPAVEPAAEPAAADATEAAAEPRKIDMSDNKEIEELARKALDSYGKKDPEGLAAIGPPGAKEKTIFIEPRNPNYQTLFGDDTWNMVSVKAWDGKILGIERGIDAAYVVYHKDETHRYAVELHKGEAGWHFYHLKQLPLGGGGGIVVNPGKSGGRAE
jgi:hypothetical protein